MRLEDYTDTGQYLKESRESLGISVEQAAASLNMRQKYILNLESGHLENMPGIAYLRGYLRNYAEYLGLDGNATVAQYEDLFARQRSGFFIPQVESRQSNPSRFILVLCAVVAISVYGWWHVTVAVTPEVENTIPDLVPEIPYTKMDKAWEECLASGRIPCFIALRTNRIHTNFILSFPD